MRMTTSRLVLFRLFNITLGRFACCERTLKRYLMKKLIITKKPHERYTASSGFFDLRDLGEGDGA